jgi:N-acetylmuramic acid 6-phosphate etherase
MTPFVRGALTSARKAGARIIFVTCDPRTELQTFVDLTIAPGRWARSHRRLDTAQGRHRHQARAQHADDGAMVLIGKTYGNLMVDVQINPRSCGPRRRIVHIVTGVDSAEAEKLLKKAHWNVKAAIVMQKTGLPYTKALARLRKSKDRCARPSARTSSRGCARSSSG